MSGLLPNVKRMGKANWVHINLGPKTLYLKFFDSFGKSERGFCFRKTSNSYFLFVEKLCLFCENCLISSNAYFPEPTLFSIFASFPSSPIFICYHCLYLQAG